MENHNKIVILEEEASLYKKNKDLENQKLKKTTIDQDSAIKLIKEELSDKIEQHYKKQLENDDKVFKLQKEIESCNNKICKKDELIEEQKVIIVTLRESL